MKRQIEKSYENKFKVITLKEIRKLVCFEADDKDFTVKPGCCSNILYLSQLLHQKHEEHLKEVTIKSKRNNALAFKKNLY